MPNHRPSYFHLHLISDATGETLTTMAKAAAVQYAQVRPIEHVHPLVRTEKQLERVLKEVEQAPGIVLYTVVKKELIDEIERRCRELKVPSLHVLEPIMKVFESYLGAPQTPIVAGQHLLDADYFGRIDALNFAMAHDDGQLPQDLEPRRHHHPRHLPHLQDADQHLPGAAWLQDCESAAGARHRAAGSAVPAAHRFRGRPGGQRRAHRRDPPQPRASDRRPQARRLCRPTQIAEEIQYPAGCAPATAGP